jgi:leucyl aminopeptidase
MSDDPMKCDKLAVDDIFVAEGAAASRSDLDGGKGRIARGVAALERSSVHGPRPSASRAPPSSRRCSRAQAGRVAGVLFGLGDGAAGEPSGPSELLIGQLPQSLPSGNYRLAGEAGNPTLAAIAWGLGSYRYARYKSSTPPRTVSLRLPEGADRSLATSTIEAVLRGRDLINTPLPTSARPKSRRRPVIWQRDTVRISPSPSATSCSRKISR